MGRWVSRWRGGISEWPFGFATADRDWDGFARWVSHDGGRGCEMGLTHVVAASQRERQQDGLSCLLVSFCTTL